MSATGNRRGVSFLHLLWLMFIGFNVAGVINVSWWLLIGGPIVGLFVLFFLVALIGNAIKK